MQAVLKPAAGASPPSQPELNEIDLLILDGKAFKVGFTETNESLSGQEGGLAPADFGS